MTLHAASATLSTREAVEAVALVVQRWDVEDVLHVLTVKDGHAVRLDESELLEIAVVHDDWRVFRARRPEASASRDVGADAGGTGARSERAPTSLPFWLERVMLNATAIDWDACVMELARGHALGLIDLTSIEDRGALIAVLLRHSSAPVQVAASSLTPNVRRGEPATRRSADPGEDAVAHRGADRAEGD